MRISNDVRNETAKAFEELRKKTYGKLNPPKEKQLSLQNQLQASYYTDEFRDRMLNLG